MNNPIKRCSWSFVEIATLVASLKENNTMKLLDGKRWRCNKSLNLLRRAPYISLYRFKQMIAYIESILNKFLNNKQFFDTNIFLNKLLIVNNY
jgi:hypothetical protein